MKEFFSYAILQGREVFSPMDWKFLEKDAIEGEHIRCHKLQENEELAKVLVIFETHNAKAVVLINTSDSYCLTPKLLSEVHESSFPVILLTRTDGEKVLQYFEGIDLANTNVYARLDVETAVDKITYSNFTSKDSGDSQHQLVGVEHTAREQSSSENSTGNL